MPLHRLDPYPVPREKEPLYINSPWLIDETIEPRLDSAGEVWEERRLPAEEEDNIRVYVPLDLNKAAILRRLEHVIGSYEEANEENEGRFSWDVEMLIDQVEIYDRIWFVCSCVKI